MLLLALLFTGCSPQPKRPALQPVPLPDVSASPEPVRRQIESAHGSLTKAVDARGTPTTELASAYGNLGMILMAADYVEAAVPCFANAQLLQPGEARWPYYLGQVYWGQGDASRAASAFERSGQLRPDDVPTLIWMGEARLAAGRLDEAEAPLRRALAVDARSAGAAFALGKVLLARHDYNEAVRLLEEAGALDPLALAVHYPLSLAYRALGDSAKADAHLRQRGDVRVRVPDPLMEEVDQLVDSVEAAEFRGTRALSAGDWKAAAGYFEHGVQLAPDNPSIRHQFATALALGGQTNEAITEFTEVVHRTPQFARSHLSLGVLLETNGRRTEALEHLSAAVDIDPDYAEGHRRLAEVLMNIGRTEQALTHFAASVRSNPRDADVRLEYADALMHTGHAADAKRELTEGARLHPDRSEFTTALSSVRSQR